jgi:hypothetical protein
MIFSRTHVAQIAYLAIFLACFAGVKSQAETRSGRMPVLLELFTSEGCSSCPPADQLLEKIDIAQPIEGADLIVLSEHVVYWNHLGWADPYSSHTFTERQEGYASRFRTEDIYTPELVVDGIRSVVGSNWPKAESAIQEALREPKIPVNVTAERVAGKAQIHIAVVPNSSTRKAVIYLALAHNRVRSQVARGENASHDLGHVAVAYSIQKVGKLDSELKFEKEVSLPLPANSKPGDIRVIVFVQRPEAGPIIGSAQSHI